MPKKDIECQEYKGEKARTSVREEINLNTAPNFAVKSNNSELISVALMR